MKKPSSHGHSETPAGPQSSAKIHAKEGRWSFNLAGESLITLGTTENARRVAYRTATGEIRFLPL